MNGGHDHTPLLIVGIGLLILALALNYRINRLEDWRDRVSTTTTVASAPP